MIPIQTLIAFFERNIEIINIQTDGLTHEQSLIQLPFRANCLNWVIGHVLTNRRNIIQLLGEENPLPSVKLDHYERESDPILGEDEGVISLEELLNYLEVTQDILARLLESETLETLQRMVPYRTNPERPLSYWLLFLYFHDSYHVGQTELLRQAAGKNDKII
jgi:hypothetical protein